MPEDPTPAPSLLEEEFKQPYYAWKADKNPRTAGALLKSLNPVIESSMRTYAGRGASPTIRSRAKLMTLEGAERYDESRAKLRTHLMSHLQGLRRVTAQESQIIPIPERVGLDLHHLRTAEAELSDRLGRTPSTAELSDHLGLSPKRIGYIRQAQPGLSEGVLAPTGEDEESAGVGPAVVSGDDSTWINFVYHDLHPIDQLIMEHSLGIHGRPKLSKQAIARRLRLSPGAVSQRAARIQEKLDKKDQLGLSFF